MRKTILVPQPSSRPVEETAWLNLAALARVELTSEEVEHPIEAALLPATGAGWRAAQPGAHTIRLYFDEPQTLRRIWLEFEERDHRRTQEFVLRWSPDEGDSYHEIVRQQWNFSPPHTIREVEEYQVELRGVKVLDLCLVPDVSGGEARASLVQWRLA